MFQNLENYMIVYGKHDKSAINDTHELVFKICNINKSETEMYWKMIPTRYVQICRGHIQQKTRNSYNFRKTEIISNYSFAFA